MLTASNCGLYLRVQRPSSSLKVSIMSSDLYFSLYFIRTKPHEINAIEASRTNADTAICDLVSITNLKGFDTFTANSMPF